MRLKPVEGATATHGCGSKLTAYDTCIVFVSSSLGERDVEWCVAVVDACPSATEAAERFLLISVVRCCV
jgi:hypothetical protein